MPIRIVLYSCDKDGEPIENSKTVYVLDKNRLTIGSEKTDDITLPKISPCQISILKINHSHYSVHKDTPSVPIKINEKHLRTDSSTIKNGDRIHLENYLLQFTIEFQTVDQHRNSNWMVFISAALILGILFLETGGIIFLAKHMAKRKLWGVEITRQRTVELLDGMRSQCENLADKAQDDLHREIIYLVEQELDSIAIYIRKFISDLNEDQVNEIYRDISHFEQILNDLEGGSLFPEKETINLHHYIIKLIKESQINSD